MNRRAFLSMSACFGISQWLNAATVPLGEPSLQGQPMRAFVQNPSRIVQNCPFWCWAASAAMIFQSHGHQLSQEEIVQKSFQAQMAICTTANTMTIGTVLSQRWVDINGVAFHSHVNAAYDIFNNYYAIDNFVMINELSNDRPLLYANTHHAMVVVAVDYFMTAWGPDVRAVGVLDPWPTNQAFHLLTPQEMYPAHLGGQMTFLAAVQTT